MKLDIECRWVSGETWRILDFNLMNWLPSLKVLQVMNIMILKFSFYIGAEF